MKKRGLYSYFASTQYTENTVKHNTVVVKLVCTRRFSFGEGMSYTTFSHQCTAGPADDPADEHHTHGTHVPSKRSFNYECHITNTGKREGDEVVQVYLRPGAGIQAKVGHPVPQKKLVEFGRVRLSAGASTVLSFSVPTRRMGLTNADGDYVLYAGAYDVIFSTGAAADVALPLSIATDQKWTNLHPN